MGKIRVVVIMDRYLPILGGAQKNVHQLCVSLIEQGWQVSVLTRRLHRDLKRNERIDGVKVHRLGWAPVRVVSKWWCGWQAARWLRKHHDEVDVVLVSAIGLYSDFLAAYLGWFWTGTPYVLRGSSLGNNFTRMLGEIGGADRLGRIVAPRALWRAALSHAASITVQSPVIQEEAHCFGIDARVIPNGVDTDRFVPRSADERIKLRRRLDLPSNRVIAIYVARYVYPKNHMVLIRAAEQLEFAGRTGRLLVLIVGTTERGQVTSNEQHLKEYVRDRRLDKLVRFVDNASNVDEYLGASDIFVFPSKFPEGMSNAVLEAMASGLPILASDAPQIRSMLPDGMDSFFDADDVSALAKRLHDMIEDPARRRDEGAKVASWAREHFASQRQRQAFEALLTSVASAA